MRAMGGYWPPTTNTTTIDAAATAATAAAPTSADDTTDATTEMRTTIHPRVQFDVLLALQILAFEEVLAL